MLDRWAGLGSRVPGLANFCTMRRVFASSCERPWAWRRNGNSRGWRPELPTVGAERQRPRDRTGSDARRGRRGRQRSFCGRTHSTTTCIRKPVRPRCKCCASGLSRIALPARICAAGGRCTILECWTRPRIICSASSRASTVIEPGVPVVVLEPSCASVFRDELRNFFPEGSARRAPAPARRSFSANFSSGTRPAISRRSSLLESAASRALPSESADEDERRRIAAPQDGR